MNLKDQITAATTSAMKSRDKQRVAALRLIKAEIQRTEVDQRIDVDDKLVIDILSKMLKQRHDSHSQYIDAGRAELAAQEAYEIDIIKSFLPKPLSADEVRVAVERAITQTNAQNMQDMGKVMAALKSELQGRADMGVVSKLIKEKLQS